MNEKPIPKEVSPELGKPFEFLRSEGLKYIEGLAGKLWTDYNIHDPGVTLLELLCYTITDLEYRISMPVKDILAHKDNNHWHMHRQFLSAIRILPSNPVTAADYRQLMVRIRGVRNAWIMPSVRNVVARYAQTTTAGKPELRYKKENETIDPETEHEFGLRGLNNILIDFDPEELLTPEDRKKEKGEQELIEEGRKQAIYEKVREVYHRYRNLCEDLDRVMEVPQQGIVLCGDIEIEPMADPELVWARIVMNIDRYLSAPVRFYSLQEMQESGYTTDQIFEGPVFSFNDGYAYRTGGEPFSKKGFIRPDELKESELRKEVRLSDLIRVIMETEGVKMVKSVEFGTCGCDQGPHEVRNAVRPDRWNVCIAHGHKPVFCSENSVLNFWKDLIPIELKTEEAETRLVELRQAETRMREVQHTEDIPMPEGKFRDPATYHTMQNHLPETYGTGPAGLAESATAQRKAQARQLKAYLLFFDQALANYFAQLANVGKLFSADISLARTYFPNAVKSLAGAGDIFTPYDGWEQEIGQILTGTGLDNYTERKNRFLDHLLARFSEQFSEYVFLMHRLYEGDAARSIIRHKVNFLEEYDRLSTLRGSGLDYYNPLTIQPDNVPGVEMRVSRLLGFNHYRRQPLSGMPYKVTETQKVIVEINGVPTEVQAYGWQILKENQVILESLNRSFTRRADAYEELGLASLLAAEEQNYATTTAATPGKVTLILLNSKKHQTGTFSGAFGEYDTDDATGISAAISTLTTYFRTGFRLEGMYVIEHMLLRPAFDTPIDQHDLFFPVCIEPDGRFCPPLDPYSFRVTVVLPGYSMRLRNKHFRRFTERMIRMEMPAHVLPRICFVNEEHMGSFEKAWQEWLAARHANAGSQQQTDDLTLNKLRSELENLFTIYEEGQLADCDDDTPEKNPVILGSSSLGSLEGSSKPD